MKFNLWDLDSEIKIKNNAEVNLDWKYPMKVSGNRLIQHLLIGRLIFNFLT